ncbi:MAG: HAMP domain-containing protein, partial [Anaerolineae bacterium]|nr:HAMP domain-containing protein [Anaerolineae bacterium]
MLKGFSSSIRVRLIGAYAFVAIMALVGSLVSYAQITRINDILASETTQRAEARYLGTKIRVETLVVSQSVGAYVAAESDSERRRIETQITDQLFVFGELVRQIEMHLEAGAADRRWGAITTINQEYAARVQAVIDAYKAEGQFGPQTAAALSQFENTRDSILATLLDYEDYETSQVYDAQYRARQTVNRSLLVTIIGASTVLIGGIGLGWIISQTITRPVSQLVQAAQRIAAGDIEQRAKVRAGGEIGLLARVFDEMTVQLRELIANLEERVEERTRQLQQRSLYLEASAEVGRAAAAILEVDDLIRRVVELIRARFDLYYVGLFLQDGAGEWAVLQAGTGEAGQAMLARRHRIKIGSGMIGWCIANAQARVAHDVGEDAVR